MIMTNSNAWVAVVIFCRTLVVFWLCLLSSVAFGRGESGYSQDGMTKAMSSSALPFEISPEGVLELIKSRAAFVLVDADDPARVPARAGEGIRHVYYARGPSFRGASELVFRDRRHGLPTAEGVAVGSQRLVGTPLDWHRLSLPFSLSPVPTRPLSLAAGQLSEAIKDGVDLQIVDLRSLQSGGQSVPFPKSMHLMPHKLLEKPSLLSKERWVVLVDDDGRIAQPIAEHLFQQGYLLTTILDGGYPAWVQFTGR